MIGELNYGIRLARDLHGLTAIPSTFWRHQWVRYGWKNIEH